MDPITAIGLLASLCSLIEASNSLRIVIKTFRDGEKEIQELCNDVVMFEEALKGFDRVLRSRQAIHNISRESIDIGLREGFATIRNLEKRLLQISGSDVVAIRRLKWVQYKPAIKRLHERLKEQSESLDRLLTVVNAFVAFVFLLDFWLISPFRETFMAMCSQYPQVLEISATTANETDSDGLSIQDYVRSETSTLASRSSIFSLHRTSLDTTPSSVGSAAASPRTSSDISPISPFIPTANHAIQRIQKPNKEASSADALMIRQACRYDCFCLCHTLGRAISIKDVPKPSELRNNCTESSCRGAGLLGEEATIPSFFRKALLAVTLARSIKTRYFLNTYRMVSEGSDALRYVKHGNLDKLKMCIQTGEATKWDTAPDGWSLLHVSLKRQYRRRS